MGSFKTEEDDGKADSNLEITCFKKVPGQKKFRFAKED